MYVLIGPCLGSCNSGQITGKSDNSESENLEYCILEPIEVSLA